MRTRLVQVLLPVLALLLGTGARAEGPAPGDAAEGPPVESPFRELYRRPPPRPTENPALVDLGRRLFWDPRASASGHTACASCHFPELGWGVTDARSRNDSGKLTSRKSQPLIGLAHAEHPLVGWDGRNASLEAQAKSSILTGSMSMRETESPVKAEVIEARIRAVPAYAEAFDALFPGRGVSVDAIVAAIAAFERTLEPGPAPFDRWVEGDATALSASARRGFELFNTTAGCAACHSGWRLTNDSFHDIGTAATDPGRGREVADDPLMRHAFKTPTLRSVALRPPYMHDASAPSLEAVIRHYERGGIDRPSRSPLLAPITLTDGERADLVAFMESLTGSPEGEARPALP